MRLDADRLVVSATEFVRHFDFIVESILPHEKVIYLSVRRRVVAVLLSPAKWSELTGGRAK